MLRFLKENKLGNLLLVPLWAIVLWLPVFLAPAEQSQAPSLPSMPLYHLFVRYNLPLNDLSFGLVVFLAYLLTQFNKKHVLIEKRTYLPALFFISLVSPGFPMEITLRGLLALGFLLWSADRAFSNYHKSGLVTSYFDAAFALSLGSLFYFNLIFFAPFIWIAIGVLRPFTLREPLTVLVGLALPWLFLWSYYFLFSSTDHFYNLIEQNTSFTASFGWFDLADFLFYSVIMLILFPANYKIITRYNSMKIGVRKYFKLLFALFVLLLLSVFLPSVGAEVLLVTAFPLSLLFTHYVLTIRNERAGTIVLIIFILIQLFEAWFPIIGKGIQFPFFQIN